MDTKEIKTAEEPIAKKAAEDVANADDSISKQLERFKKVVDEGIEQQKKADMVRRYGDLVAKGTDENKIKAKAEPVKTELDNKVQASTGPVTYEDVYGENPGVEGLVEKPWSVQIREKEQKLRDNSGSLDEISPEDFYSEEPSGKKPINTTVNSKAENGAVKVNNDSGAAKVKIASEIPVNKRQAAQALKNAEEKTAFKGLKKVGAYAAGALALAGLTSALIGSKGQQTNDQLYGQQPLY